MNISEKISFWNCTVRINDPAADHLPSGLPDVQPDEDVKNIYTVNITIYFQSIWYFHAPPVFYADPQEVIEAARLDDADNRKIMFKVMMPMAKPALITIGLLSFISTWNNYFWPLIMTSSETLRTLPVGIAALKSSETLQMWHIIMAGNVVLVLPILIVYMLASQKIRNSFVYSGIK